MIYIIAGVFAFCALLTIVLALRATEDPHNALTSLDRGERERWARHADALRRNHEERQQS